jgi:DNA-binding response OmpR family regulator
MLVLLVEDDEDLGELVKYNLEKNQFKVDWVLDGKEALERIKTNRYNLIILDLMLPGVSGLDICREIRENRRSTLPFPAMKSSDGRL